MHKRHSSAVSRRGAYKAILTGQDPNNDLALLHTDMDNLSIAAFRFWPRIGEQVASYGFPYSGVLSSSGNFTLGHVTSLIGVKDDTRFLQISAPISLVTAEAPFLTCPAA